VERGIVKGGAESAKESGVALCAGRYDTTKNSLVGRIAKAGLTKTKLKNGSIFGDTIELQTASLFAWLSGARMDFEVKDAPEARRLQQSPVGRSLSSKSIRASLRPSNQ
jgi:hypothetical protein